MSVKAIATSAAACAFVACGTPRPPVPFPASPPPHALVCPPAPPGSVVPSAAVPPPPAATVTAPAPPAPPEKTGIIAFDCTTVQEEHAGWSLRAWNSGGPDGVTWNWYGDDLICSVTVRGTCNAHALVAFYPGRGSKGLDTTLSLSGNAHAVATFRIPARVWEKALETSRDVSYDLLLLTVRVEHRCTDEDDGPTPTSHWADSFVGGFYGGE